MEKENKVFNEAEAIKETDKQLPKFSTGALNPHLMYIDMDGMVGRNAQELMKELTAKKFSFRVMREDKESFAGIMNYNPGRINLEIDNGIITRSYGG